MSESNLRLLFKEFTGSSLIEYRNRIRITEARKLIDSGEFSVAEAAYLVGFNNMSFFYDQMKAY
jgi:AraC-like DNA-binding protein